MTTQNKRELFGIMSMSKYAGWFASRKHLYGLSRLKNIYGSQWIEQYPKEKIWELMPDDVFLTTTQVGNLIGCTNQCAYMKLRELLDEGKVVRSNVSRYYIWKRVGTP